MIRMEVEQIMCPGCDRPVEVKLVDSACSGCGLEFRTMSIFITEALATGESISKKILQPVSVRIGEYLVEHKVITSRQLEDALQVQQSQLTQGKRNQLGHILINSGVIDRNTFEYYLALHTLQLKLQLIFAYMNHSMDSDKSQVIPEPIYQIKENLLAFVIAIKNTENSLA